MELWRYIFLSCLVAFVGILSAQYFTQITPLITLTTLATLFMLKFQQGEEDPPKISFHTLHTLDAVYKDQARSLVSSEWPSLAGDEDNHVRTGSFDESSDSLDPCHVVALAEFRASGKPLVVAHAVLRQANQFSKCYASYLKMHKMGQPDALIKQAIEINNLDYDMFVKLLNMPDTEDVVQLIDAKNNTRKVCLASVVVTMAMRRQGLGKAMCAFAAKTAHQGGASALTGTPRNLQLVEFYEKLGGKVSKQPVVRKDMPKVKVLDKAMYRKLDEEVLNRADGILAKFNGKEL